MRLLFSSMVLAAVLTACGGAGSSGPPTLSSISVAPATIQVIAGLTQPLAATGHYSDGHTADLTSTASWASSQTVTATVSSGGVVTGIAVGTTIVSATQGSAAGSASVTVTAPVPQAISLAPPTAAIRLGYSFQLFATLTLTNTATTDATSMASWVSDAPAIADVSAGKVHGVALGGAHVSANLGALSATTLVNVVAPSSQVWSYTGWVPNGEGQSRAVLLSNGAVYLTGASAPSYDVVFDPATGIVTQVADPGPGSAGATFTPLAGNNVLITGGGDAIVDSAESTVFDPVAHIVVNRASMATARTDHTATLLSDGRVLVVGGTDVGQAVLTAEIYDGATNTWAAAGTLSSPHVHHTSTLLADGRVLVVGGGVSQGSTSSEVYDAHTNGWTQAAQPTYPRLLHTSTLLKDGRVLVAGGASGIGTSVTGGTPVTEIYDPVTNTWTSAGPFADGLTRVYHSASLLPSGLVLVSGGFIGSGGTSSATVELFDANAGLWSIGPPMQSPRAHHAMTLLPNGSLLVTDGDVGSNPLSTCESYW